MYMERVRFTIIVTVVFKLVSIRGSRIVFRKLEQTFLFEFFLVIVNRHLAVTYISFVLDLGL